MPEHRRHPARRGPAGRGGRGPRRRPNATPVTAPPRLPAKPSKGPEDRPQTTSWLLAADEIAGRPAIETVRGAGFTTAVTFPTRGIFGGQGSIIDLFGGAADMVVVPAVGQYMRGPKRRFRRQRRGIPRLTDGHHLLRPADLSGCRSLQAGEGSLRPGSARHGAARTTARSKACWHRSAFCCRPIAWWRSTACCTSPPN